MPTPDQIRITDDRSRPRITELWWALRPLTSVVRFMNTGAHPDDETTAMLAALAFRDGINLSYACSTRGEGGQNDIGTETGASLGALRTREMERACDILGMRMYWHSEGPSDSITDFGFSKSGAETLGKWGRERTLKRFVEIVRSERPDIICPTFLDVPGQHGHHRAMTEAAHLVMTAAADPDFASNLPPWQVKKLYLPAWSGAGQSYDDDEPPPPVTIVVPASDGDPVSGWSWERIGQQSRAFHRTQGMGRWMAPGAGRNWPLHLAETHVSGPDIAVTSGLAVTLGDLAGLPGAGQIAEPLHRAQDAITAAVAAFPDFGAVAHHAWQALEALCVARINCPDAARDEILHRLDGKEVQLGHVLRLALGVEARARSGDTWLAPGQSTTVTTELGAGSAESAELTLDLPEGWDRDKDRLVLSEEARPTDGYRAFYDPAVAEAPAILLRLGSGEATATVRLPFEVPPVVLPEPRAVLGPTRALINRRSDRRRIEVAISGVSPEGLSPTLVLPDGWRAEAGERGVTLILPEDVATGLYHLPLEIGGSPVMTARRISYPHIAPTAHVEPAGVTVRVLEAELPKGRVGYVGAGNDRVGHWLAELGVDVTELSDRELNDSAALAGYDTIVIGIFAMRFRPGLADAMPGLHGWAEAGGTLVTLYHRPWDNWNPGTTPPRRLEIGQPSLRWRVTNEAAEVRHLADHPLLRRPNLIGPQDWQGWVKERGLYFAKSWDAAYVPLLEMADPGEAPHHGALLVASVGAGRHVHCALILHHQMENLVPGAFRLMANLIAPGR